MTVPLAAAARHGHADMLIVDRAWSPAIALRRQPRRRFPRRPFASMIRIPFEHAVPSASLVGHSSAKWADLLARAMLSSLAG
jgi:hypothetical protein